MRVPRLTGLLALVAAVGSLGGCSQSTPTESSGGSSSPSTRGNWRATSVARGLSYARFGHSAVWTGSTVIIWGGSQGEAVTFPQTGSYGYIGVGAIYHVASDSWSRVTTAWSLVTPGGELSPRAYHTAVWTGSKMIVWGGCSSAGSCDNSNGLSDGSIYDPLSDSWEAISSKGGPSGLAHHVAVWTGSRMIVWGGSVAGPTGGLYDPARDEWAPMNSVGAPTPRVYHTGVWTGSRLIVWGGLDPDPLTFRLQGTGGIYDPTSNTWARTSDIDAPVARYHHTAVWTGSRMIVWGGTSSKDAEATGGLYDPATDSWSPTRVPVGPEPGAREEHTSVWTGSRMIVWGGIGYRNSSWSYLSSGASYDPETGVWVPLESSGAPPPRHLHTAVWTGSRMIVWGGHGVSEYQGGAIDTGGVYDPQSPAR